jgi:hypothetical protein
MNSDIDALSINISQAFKRKYPEIDQNHYSQNNIKDYIHKTNINFRTKDGIQKIISSLTQTMNQLKLKMNKEHQSKGQPQNQNHIIIQNQYQIPQQNLVVQNKIQENVNNYSRKEFLNKNPLIVDPSTLPIQPYLNHIESKNNMVQNNYQSFPSPPNQKDMTLSTLSSLPSEINQTDRFILMDKQKNLLKEDTSEWTYYLVIDSKDRDMKSYKSPNEYTIRFSPPSFNNNDPITGKNDARSGFVDRIMHNVKSIELIKCGFLDTSDLTDSSDSSNNNPPYVILEVEEFGTNHNGTNQYLNKSLAIMDTFTKQDNYKYFDVMYDDKPMINKFNPRVTIDKMTIRFRLPDGTLYNFGGANDENRATVNYLVFKITVMQRFLETQYLNKTDG